MEHGNLKELIAIDLDSSDNLSEEIIFKFISIYGPQLQGMLLSFEKSRIMNKLA